MASSSNHTNPEQRQRSAWAWPLAVVICGVTLILVLGKVLYGCTPAGIVSAFKPEVRISCHTAISTSIDKMKRTGKLVVLQSELSAEVTKESSKVVEVLGHPLDLGTTTVQLRCSGNKIQYFVPLERITSDTFSYNAASKRLVVTVPAPILDTGIVEIQSDPTKIEIQTRVGWGRLDSKSGQALRKLAQMELRSAIIAEGRSSVHLDAAKQEAQHQLQKILAPLASQLCDDVQLVVAFR